MTPSNSPQSASPATFSSPSFGQPADKRQSPHPSFQPSSTFGNQPSMSAAPLPKAIRSNTDTDEAREAAAKRQRETQQDLGSRYIVKGGEYRFKANPAVVAFRDEGKKLSTDLDRPAVAKSIVAAAEVKGWKALRVSGTEEFKREAWIEASVRGIKALGHEPTKDDLERVARERQARFQTRTEPTLQRAATDRSRHDPAVVLLERHLAQQKDLSPELRARVLAAGHAHSAQLAEAGVAAKVRVFDPKAERAAPSPAPHYEPHRDRGARVR